MTHTIKADYEIRTTLDLPDGDQVARLDGTPVEFDALTPDQQRQLTGACWHELDGGNR